jgi:hypothetical protein
MSNVITMNPRPLQSAPTPLGLYFRPGRVGHNDLTQILLSGPQKFFGAVIDATMVENQKELRSQLLSSKLDAVLDPQTQASAFEHGHRPSMAKLPWGSDRPHRVDDFKELAGRQRIIKLAEFAVQNSFTQMLAPSHYISSPNDQWFGVDCELVRWLRVELDKRGGKDIPIIYSLAISNALFKDKEQRAALIAGLANLPIGSIWIKVDGLGADAGPITLTHALDAISDFHSLGLPIIGDQIGGIPGLALLAFGAVGGIAHGITQGEKFSSKSWRKPPTKPGGGGWRIYFPPLGLSLTRKEAEALLASSPQAMAKFGNRNTLACPRGIVDMLHQPVRAFVIQRAEEVAGLAAVPEALRPQNFVEKTVRPLTDCSLAATRINWKPDDPLSGKLATRLANHRKRVENHRIILGARADRSLPRTISVQPETRIVREGAH